LGVELTIKLKIMKTIIEQIVEIIAREFGIEENKITPQTNLTRDFGSDSLNQIRVIIGLEEQFDLQISDVEAVKIETVQDAVDYVTERSKAPV